MTANELADLLDFDAKTLNWKAFADAATMLRQQQAEIGCYKIELELHKAMIQDLEKGLASSITLNKAQAEIEALKKQIPDWENINKPNPFIGLSENSNHKPLPPNSGLGGSALKKASNK